jgi:hypothetical protein
MPVLKVSEAIAMLQENHQLDDLILVDWLGKDEVPVRVALGQGDSLTELEWSKCLEQVEDYELFDENLLEVLMTSAFQIYTGRDAS